MLDGVSLFFCLKFETVNFAISANFARGEPEVHLLRKLRQKA